MCDSAGGLVGGFITAVTSGCRARQWHGYRELHQDACGHSNLVIFPTRGLVVSASLRWMAIGQHQDLSRDVTDAAIALTVMAGEIP